MKDPAKLTLWGLGWPIMIEMFLQFMIGTVDTLMVSRISDEAVAAVGICNQFFQVVLVLFVTIDSGMGVVVAQKLGAGRTEEARSAAITALILNMLIGLVLSLILLFAAEPMARLLQVPEAVMPLAVPYLSIVGGGTFFTVVVLTLNTVIRNTGNTRGPMVIGIGMNLLHIVGNALFIYGALGFPKWGLSGVAWSTNFSRIAALLFLFYIFRQAFPVLIRIRDLKKIDVPILKEITRIGWPMSINAASWTFTQMIIFSIIAMMGVHELAARTYMNTIESFSFLCGWSLAMAVQIQIAHLYGAGRIEEAYRAAWKAFYAGLAVVMTNTLLMYVFGKQILHIFTGDTDIVRIGLVLLGMNLLLQPGKMVNMAFGNALTAVGDTRFIMASGFFSLWVISVGVSYWLGLTLGWGLVGVYIAMISDEAMRGLFSVIRWKRKSWYGAARPAAARFTEAR
ncbi:MATE family efflux transporter [Paenibacillus filicis]|uniref:MATE family efflux transporter n=1 Tax=Paenibacillus gyeongsangnamensis TaxID=3388067 RepID=A0ABT4Q7B9_9BACL|nr:MATE family efflux transporter [Paenibacillus filicis]MCZ8512691.1 MATE family efflux transporter [Paenibacillus filicis]